MRGLFRSKTKVGNGKIQKPGRGSESALPTQSTAQTPEFAHNSAIPSPNSLGLQDILASDVPLQTVPLNHDGMESTADTRQPESGMIPKSPALDINRQLPPLIIPTGVDGDSVPPPAPCLHFLFGQKDPNSRYFTQRIIQAPSSILNRSEAFKCYIHNGLGGDANASQLTFHAPDLDANSFHLYETYKRTGVLPYQWRDVSLAKTVSWPQCWPLINAHIFAVTIGDIDFADYMMDVIEDRLSSAQSADLETIRHLFSKSDDSKVLKQLVIDRCFEAALDNIQKRDRQQNLPESYMIDVNSVIDQFLSERSEKSGGSCRYHLHGQEIECYQEKQKRQALGREIKSGIEQYNREKTTANTEEACRNAKTEGVQGMDWADPENCANAKLGEEHGKRWFSFRRHDKDPGASSSSKQAPMESGGTDQSESETSDVLDASGSAPDFEDTQAVTIPNGTNAEVIQPMILHSNRTPGAGETLDTQINGTLATASSRCKLLPGGYPESL
ncbi:hypothetical protein BS50DRAFT_587388 [Corynespora cassiicola Philippines]|uniref:BTB domain-containing protein n=1 Tax=Corynespora cassiicola Philippines TaxID=1448308 RepID=A0A2T2NSY8_CORCC|nr:hypothetical protein BS50DRAFT_587388 [Corynespora cassiicola Philippines]